MWYSTTVTHRDIGRGAIETDLAAFTLVTLVTHGTAVTSDDVVAKVCCACGGEGVGGSVDDTAWAHA